MGKKNQRRSAERKQKKAENAIYTPMSKHFRRAGTGGNTIATVESVFINGEDSLGYREFKKYEANVLGRVPRNKLMGIVESDYGLKQALKKYEESTNYELRVLSIPPYEEEFGIPEFSRFYLRQIIPTQWTKCMEVWPPFRQEPLIAIIQSARSISTGVTVQTLMPDENGLFQFGTIENFASPEFKARIQIVIRLWAHLERIFSYVYNIMVNENFIFKINYKVGCILINLNGIGFAKKIINANNKQYELEILDLLYKRSLRMFHEYILFMVETNKICSRETKVIIRKVGPKASQTNTLYVPTEELLKYRLGLEGGTSKEIFESFLCRPIYCQAPAKGWKTRYFIHIHHYIPLVGGASLTLQNKDAQTLFYSKESSAMIDDLLNDQIALF